jgi:hypothetical protein
LWTQYRTANSAASAAIYLSKTTDNGANWSTPIIPYNNPNAGIFQGFGWVKVTADHTVHVTFLGGTTSNTTAAQFYVQSTDGGATWSAPLQLSATTISTFASTTDYIADDVKLTGGQGAILAGLEEDNGHHARIGTFDSTPTPTVTGTPPTNTPTLTRTNTPTVTPTVCGVSNPYSYATATGTIVPGVDDTGNHCDDCLTTISLPFAYTLYDQTFTSASVDSNGTLQFVSFGSFLRNTCLPSGGYTYTIFPYWDDLITANSGYGIFTSVSGTAPNRIFNIEWRAQYYPNSGTANFEVRLYEGQKRLDIIYATLTGEGTIATIGAQRDSSNYTQFECNAGVLSHGFMLTFTQPSCGTPSPVTATPINTPTPTPDPCATVWSVVPSPNGDLTNNLLAGVAAIADDDVWAVGNDAGPGAPMQTLVEHWGGSTWSVVPSPNLGTNGSGLTSVAAITSNDMWAVGQFSTGTVPHTLTEHWDGSAWSIVPSPNIGTAGNVLNAVTAVAANDVWAVGYAEGSGFTVNETLVEHWDGSAWTIVPSPNTGTRTNSLVGVTARSQDDVWTVGTAYDGIINQTLAEHWDGSTWSVVPSPNVGASHNYLYAVSVPHGGPGGSVWAVGQYFDPASGYQTLAERTAQPCATPLPTFTALPSFTSLPSGTPTRTTTSAPATATNTSVPPTNTSVPPTDTPGAATETPTACTISFEDVPVGSTFYPYVHCLVCLGIINGYPDGTFRPNANVTRGQLSKIVSNSAGFSDTPTGQQFQDVPPSGPGSTFYVYIYRLVHRGYINGYECGAPPVGPCMPPDNLAYFLPNAPATRGQISKIVSNAAGFNEPPSGEQFQDVAPNSTFYTYIYRLSTRGIINGYPCAAPGEPCVPPDNWPYFRPNANATRGQMSKIDAAAFFPSCNIPSR